MKSFRPVNPPIELSPEDGVLLVDKPSGPTSHDIVDRIRRLTGIKKVGHGGTLDPMATGLLVLLTGRGTKISERVMGHDKVYEGTLHLGATTDTQDIDGTVQSEVAADHITAAQVEAEMAKFTGDIMQTPPMVSAIKHQGTPLYKLARKGETVERKPRLIHIYSFKLLDFANPLARFRLKCTKGTYVRTLCADIGQNLGVGAFLQQLRRTQIGHLSVNEAVSLDALEKMSHAEILARIIPLTGFSMQGADRP